MERYNNMSENDIKQFIACDKEIRDLGIGILTFSDNPNAEGESRHGLWGIGKQYSYIKMSENAERQLIYPRKAPNKKMRFTTSIIIFSFDFILHLCIYPAPFTLYSNKSSFCSLFKIRY